MNRDQIIDSIRDIVIDAGNIICNSVHNDISILEKTSSKDIVTQYDIIIQEHIMNGIHKQIPNAEFLSEESYFSGDLSADDLFIIDPIDGTTNFVHSLNYSAISVAWYKKGSPFYGIVYNPYSKEIYEAEAGKGAFLNSRRIYVSTNSLKDSVVAFGTSPYNSETTDSTFELIKKVYDKCQDIRRMGSAALDICFVASGRIGLYFEAALSLWDYAAARLILLEAGGMIVDFSGKDIDLKIEKSSVIVGNRHIIIESDLIRGE